MARKPRILFITGERPALGLMSEGFVRYLAGSMVDVETAGKEHLRDDPYCLWAMNETGIDVALLPLEPLSRKNLSEFTHIVVVDTSAVPSNLPPGTHVEHWQLPDPGNVRGEPRDRIQAYRAVRNRVEQLVKDLLVRALEGRERATVR